MAKKFGWFLFPESSSWRGKNLDGSEDIQYVDLNEDISLELTMEYLGEGICCPDLYLWYRGSNDDIGADIIGAIDLKKAKKLAVIINRYIRLKEEYAEFKMMHKREPQP